MNFDEAVKFVLNSRKEAFSFIPEIRSNKVIGGGIYIINYDEDYDEKLDGELDLICIDYSGGRFYDSCGEEDFYRLDDVPPEAKNLSYIESMAEKSHAWGSWETQFALKLLYGYSLEEAGSEHSCQECDQILYKTGKVNKCKKCSNDD